MPVKADDARAAGNQSAVASCVRAFERELDFVYRVLRRQGATRADAEDLAQEVFLILWRRWGEYRQDQPLRPWLGAIAAHVAMKHWARRRREVPLASIEPPDGAALPDDDLASARARNLARQAIALLPERHRTALVMHEIDEIPVKDLAALWAVPLFTAYTRIRVARGAFAKIATGLLAKPDRSHPALTPDALLAIERVPERAPERARKGVQTRLRALLLVPTAHWPTPELSIPPPAAGGVSAVLIVGAAVVTLGMLVLFFVPRHPSTTVGVDDPPARDPSVSLTRAPPPRLLVPPPPAPQPRLIDPAPPPPLTPAAALARGLVGHWRLDDGPGATARDSSGHAQDCVVQGGAWIDGAHGGAISFERSGHLECPQFDARTTAAAEVTLVAWMKPKQLPSGHRALAVRDTEGALGDYFFLGLKGMDLVVTSRAWRANLVYTLPATANGWVQAAFTHAKNGATKLYVDGIEVGQSTARPRGAVHLTGPLSIGAGVPRAGQGRPDRPRQAFHGAVDDVLLYDRALDKDEIAWLAAGTQPQAD
jgi:RNA polymerase sigma factor (sigma-70 family)